MIGRLVVAGLVVVAAGLSPAWAQTGAPANPPSPKASPPAAADAGRFVVQAPTDAWRASRLVGLAVYGSDETRIGDINEVLLDREGRATIAVIGVGGFLGIGEKDVGVPFKALEWIAEPRAGAATSTAASVANSPAIPVVPGPNAPGAGTTGPVPGARDANAPAPMTGAATPAANAGAGALGSAAAGMNSPGVVPAPMAGRTEAGPRFRPDHAVLRMTKADLQNAPAFRFGGDGAAGSSNPAGSAAPSGNR